MCGVCGVCGVWHITIVVQGVVTGCDMGMAWWVWHGDVVWHGGCGMVGVVGNTCVPHGGEISSLLL